MAVDPIVTSRESTLNTGQQDQDKSLSQKLVQAMQIFFTFLANLLTLVLSLARYAYLLRVPILIGTILFCFPLAALRQSSICVHCSRTYSLWNALASGSGQRFGQPWRLSYWRGVCCLLAALSCSIVEIVSMCLHGCPLLNSEAGLFSESWCWHCRQFLVNLRNRAIFVQTAG